MFFRIRIPNTDTVYRAIKSNHKVLMSRQHALERVTDQLHKIQLMNQNSAWDNFNSAINGLVFDATEY